MRTLSFLTLTFLWLGTANSAAASEIVVDAWTLRATVQAEGIGTDSRVSTTVQNPFELSQFASIQNSTASSIYTASWDARGFFQMTVLGQHAAAGHPILLSRSTGRIDITPQVDSIVTFDAEYNYMLGSGDRVASMSSTVSIGAQPVFVFYEQRLTLLGAHNGQISLDSADIFLAADVQYTLGYGLQLESFSGSPSSLSHGDGFVNINIVPVPEPATLFLLVVTLPWLRCPRR